ncbi:MAG: hypothetical protein ACXAC2_14075, partial [Candidatus Kariarchaeaceae archaeon]
VQNKVTKSNMVFPSISFSYSQIILDLITLLVIFEIVNLFHIELFLLHRFFTTTLVLAFSLFFLGTMGNEVWISYIKTPANALNKIRELQMQYIV